jgi:hypothetical protein
MLINVVIRRKLLEMSRSNFLHPFMTHMAQSMHVYNVLIVYLVL